MILTVLTVLLLILTALTVLTITIILLTNHTTISLIIVGPASIWERAEVLIKIFCAV